MAASHRLNLNENYLYIFLNYVLIYKNILNVVILNIQMFDVEEILLKDFEKMQIFYNFLVG
jgi:hypothetical protein